ncbi:GlxA family transcriptional regulator [Tahibacter soli]|uniref:DJ-1/PfpI family protein n=1 Tax=Tahibacter soli TaxID=2983605 RepID=A0A9X3YNM7_9GAMM|nr:helix-turn-helix domain-containing protein [Tahibacter soli]MDC8015666.1 DJ-1/PfpI family protein [Tahibacter soli]
MPRDVWFVVPPDLVLLDFAGAAEAFRLAAQDGVPLQLRYAATGEGAASTSLGIGLTGFGALPPTLAADDIVIVCGARGNGEVLGTRGGRQIVAWLRDVVAPSGCLLACICAGALLAGRAGLLAGRRCTTHHSLVNLLREVAPDADVLDSRVFVEDDGLFTSAGITAGIDLALHLIASLASPRLSAEVARELVVYLRRAPDDPALSPWIEGRNHMDARVHAVQDQLIREPERNWTLDELARAGHMSVRTLTRRFREMAGASVHDYHARLRVALARQALAAGASVEAAAMQAGVGSARQLRRLWSAHAAGTPGEASARR